MANAIKSKRKLKASKRSRTTTDKSQAGNHALPRQTFTIAEFCAAHDLSRAFFYLLRKAGRGPRIMNVGARRLISIEAAAAWRRQMEVKAA
jgi:hypothetical protein